MREGNILPVKSDIIFRLFFADERNKELLIGFLQSVLRLPEDDYDEIEIIDPHLLREYEGDKLGIIDIKLHTKSKRIIHVEIQLRVTQELRNRIVFYDAKLVTEQMGSGDNYDALQRVISIVILDEDLIDSDGFYHHRFTLYDPETGVELSDLIEIHTLELNKLPEHADGTQLYDWAKFIDAESEEELRVIEERNPQVGKAVVKYRELTADERVRDTIFRREMMRRDIAAVNKLEREEGRQEGRREGRQEGRREGRQEGRREGRREGRQEGRREEKSDVARNLLILDIPIDKIMQSTGLTREEIENLRK